MFPLIIILLCMCNSVISAARKQSFDSIMQRDNLKHLDTKYLILHEHAVGRYNRTSPYGYNLNMTILQPWGNNVTMEVKAYENRNNGYKETLVRVFDFKERVCDLMDSSNLVVLILKHYGNLSMKTCPVANNFYIKNLRVPPHLIPPDLPASHLMLSFKLYVPRKKILILDLEVFFQITPVVKSIKRGK